MTEPPARPLPTIDDENRPFWTACAAGELRMQQCTVCGHIRYPIQPLCPNCLSDQADWTLLSGRGTVLAKVVYHQAFSPAFKADVPYNVVLVQLAEGPRMYSNVIGVPLDGFAVGDAVQVEFDEIGPEIYLPRFRPV
jgi:uncharacterized protein